MNTALSIFGRPAGELHGDEHLQDDTLADLGTYHDDKGLHDHLHDALNGGELYDQLHKLLSDVLETREGEPVTVHPDFKKALVEAAINYRRGV